MNQAPHFKKLCQRECLLQWRKPQRLVNAALFFIMVIVFFPLAMPASLSLIQTMAPGLVWVAVLLSILLASEGLFQQEHESGILDQWLLSGHPLVYYITAKLTAYWLFTIAGLLLLCPILSLAFGMSFWAAVVLAVSLFLCSPAMLALCFLAAAFSVGRQQKGLLTALVLLPLALPLMVFGSATVNAAIQGLSIKGHLALQLAILILGLSSLPWTIAAVLKISASSD